MANMRCCLQLALVGISFVWMAPADASVAEADQSRARTARELLAWVMEGAFLEDAGQLGLEDNVHVSDGDAGDVTGAWIMNLHPETPPQPFTTAESMTCRCCLMTASSSCCETCGQQSKRNAETFRNPSTRMDRRAQQRRQQFLATVSRLRIRVCGCCSNWKRSVKPERCCEWCDVINAITLSSGPGDQKMKA